MTPSTLHFCDTCGTTWLRRHPIDVLCATCTQPASHTRITMDIEELGEAESNHIDHMSHVWQDKSGRTMWREVMQVGLDVELVYVPLPPNVGVAPIFHVLQTDDKVKYLDPFTGDVLLEVVRST